MNLAIKILKSKSIDEISRLKAFLHRNQNNKENSMAKAARFHLIRKALPAQGGKKICYHKLTTKGCPGGTGRCSGRRLYQRSRAHQMRRWRPSRQVSARCDPNSKQGETLDRIVYRPLKGAALDIEGGPELTTREVVLCRAADNKCSKAMVLCQIF
jgi:hypothetical protein